MPWIIFWNGNSKSSQGEKPSHLTRRLESKFRTGVNGSTMSPAFLVLCLTILSMWLLSSCISPHGGYFTCSLRCVCGGREALVNTCMSCGIRQYPLKHLFCNMCGKIYLALPPVGWVCVLCLCVCVVCIWCIMHIYVYVCCVCDV